ncbi:MAG: hypothetical protein R3C05_12990 [Pirellulaceae bacterium]
MAAEKASPRVGTLSILGASALFMLQFCFAYWLRFYYGSLIGRGFWIGIMWLGVTVNALVCFTALASWRRAIVGLIVLALHVMVMTYGWGGSSLRYTILFGFLTTWITVTSTFMRLPVWLSWRVTEGYRPQPIRFSIRSVLLITTIVAVLMAASRIYQVVAIMTQLVAVPYCGLFAVGAAWTMLASDHLRLRAICLTIVLVCGSLSYSVLATCMIEVVLNEKPLVVVLQSLGTWIPDGFTVRVHLIQFGVFTLGICIAYALGRLDDHEFQLRKKRRKDRLKHD